MNGFSTKGNGPQPNQHPPIEKYFIQKLNKDSTDLDCGEKAANCTSNDDHGDCSKDSS